ncbi:MAG: hypothetical protein K6G62_08780 [Eubacterium sp.]|nr:hypothetical protein [Eubacterium sp.]
MTINPIGPSSSYGKYSPKTSATPEVRAEVEHIGTVTEARRAGMSQGDIKTLEHSGTIECETCKNRKYQDGSDENVSFKSAAHISPEAAGTRVRAHEQEHVTNAYDKAEVNDGKVIRASVQIKTAICPECGRPYVSGGLTTTQIKYNSDQYDQEKKARDATGIKGSKLDIKLQ